MKFVVLSGTRPPACFFRVRTCRWGGGALVTLAICLLCTDVAAGTAEIHEIAVADGSVVSIAIAPGGNGAAAGIEGLSEDMDNPLSEVRWWNWNGTDGRQKLKDFSAPHALAWDKDGSLLAGGWALSLRIPTLWWWRLGPGGAVVTECKATPPHDGSIHAYPHGIVSIAPLRTGKPLQAATIRRLRCGMAASRIGCKAACAAPGTRM